MIHRARLRMCALARAQSPGTVAYWDARTSMDDARIALQLAHGHAPDEISNRGYLLTDGAS